MIDKTKERLVLDIIPNKTYHHQDSILSYKQSPAQCNPYVFEQPITNQHVIARPW